MSALLPYRPCVGLMLINKGGLVFIGNRLSGSSQQNIGEYSWQMPQGGIDVGEDPLKAAYRELYEETNVRSVTLLAQSQHWYSYDLPNESLKKSFNNKYRGQTQKWFAFRFEGDESEIDISSPAGGAKPEFHAWSWEKMSLLPSLIVPFKRDVYENVCREFAHLGA